MQPLLGCWTLSRFFERQESVDLLGDKILRYMSAKELVAIRLVSKFFKTLIETRVICEEITTWKKHLEKVPLRLNRIRVEVNMAGLVGGPGGSFLEALIAPFKSFEKHTKEHPVTYRLDTLILVVKDASTYDTWVAIFNLLQHFEQKGIKTLIIECKFLLIPFGCIYPGIWAACILTRVSEIHLTVQKGQFSDVKVPPDTNHITSWFCTLYQDKMQTYLGLRHEMKVHARCVTDFDLGPHMYAIRDDEIRKCRDTQERVARLKDARVSYWSAWSADP